LTLVHPDRRVDAQALRLPRFTTTVEAHPLERERGGKKIEVALKNPN
jgi:hypothetical protein